jgi:predicted DNA-binding WGR domain protein
MNQRSLRYTDGKSDKFWEIRLVDTSHTVRYGRHGTAGQIQTKDFATEAEALKSYEKLVAEKLKKGYVDDGGAIASAPKTTATPKSAKPKTAAVPAIVEAPAPPQLNYPPVRSIDLAPEDWFWATWRNLPPLPRPEAKPFDRKQALQQLGEITSGSWTGNWDWSKAKIATSLSPEEAYFWLMAMTEAQTKRKPKDLINELADKPINIISLEVFQENLFSAEMYMGKYYPPEVYIPLANLFPLKALTEIIIYVDELLESSKNGKNMLVLHILSNLTFGFIRYIVPYLTTTEVNDVRVSIQSALDLNRWPYHNNYDEASPIFYLAAHFGLGHELQKLVEQWPDEQYRVDSNSTHVHRPQEIIFGLENAHLVESHFRRLHLSLQPSPYVQQTSAYIRAWLACTEYVGLDHICETIVAASNREDATSLTEGLALVQSPEAAPYMLELTHTSKSPQITRQWLEANPDHAIAGLIPTAAGKGKLAEAAIDFLRSMKRKGHAAYIQTCLDHESAEIAAKIRSTILDVEEKTYIPFDPQTTPEWLQQAIEQAPAKPTKNPSWNITPLDLPPIVIGTQRLNDFQVEVLLNTLRQSKLDSPPPLLASLKTHADRTALDAFSWKLFEAWLAEGAPSKENWAMTQIGLCGNDASALKLAPMIRLWPGESQHQRAVLGLECLRTIDTDTALMQINGIAQKVKFKGIKQRAQECMEAIAQGRGMSRAELEDRIVPDCDLDAQGTRLFDFGPRQFRFVLGADLKPMLKDPDGKIKADLPKPNSKDDPAKAESAIADWKLFKKQLSEIIKLQPDRLEQAMITGRRWAVNDFITLLVEHPLMTHLVQRLIWGGYDTSGQLIDTFRVTEDRTYADRHDATFTLDSIAQIGIVHPLHLSAETLSSWGEILSDYEIVAAFPQLGRAIHSLEPSEASQTEITRFKDAKVPAVTLVGMLEKSGWARGIPEDAGVFSEHSKPFYGANVTAIVQYYGVPVGYMEGWEDQSIERCFFLEGIYTPQMYPDHKKAIGLQKIDPVVISEILQDLTAIAAKAQ